jgi:hypothetical protein
MRIPWRLPLLLSACVVLGQLLHLAPLLDLAAGTVPADVRLAYPTGHVLLAPLTLLADWLNGSPARDLKGFVAWALAAYGFWRLAARRGPTRGAPRRARRELRAGALFLGALALYAAWGALVPRPIPRLVAPDPDVLIFDLHSHTAASHDGRRGFDAAANAAWHARAGFHAAFVTDHNTARAIRGWRGNPARGALLLPGIELSLSGLHLLALGTDREIASAPYRGDWGATGRLVRALAAGDTAAPPAGRDARVASPAGVAGSAAPFLVASLPEYWEHHWGADLDTLVAWGVRGLEVWTTSPRAMDFPPALRRETVARCRRDGLVLFAATDMHGIGYTASAWNVTRVRGWRRLEAGALGAVLVAKFRRDGPAADRVVVLRRWLPETVAQAAVAVPLNLVLLLRTTTPAHGAALLVWIWLPALLLSFRRRTPRP